MTLKPVAQIITSTLISFPAESMMPFFVNSLADLVMTSTFGRLEIPKIIRARCHAAAAKCKIWNKLFREDKIVIKLLFHTFMYVGSRQLLIHTVKMHLRSQN